MADFESEYEQSTNTIDSLVTSQLSPVTSWITVPGALTKTSSSPMGFVWGFNSSNQIFKCQLPCTGNWQVQDVSQFNVTTVLDITSDSANVYILTLNTSSETVMLINTAAGTGVWNMNKIPFAAKNIFSTHTYIWAQDGSNSKQKCAKPCIMANWIAVPDTTVTISSSSETSLYGRDATGVGMKTDENMQSAWSPITGLSQMKVSNIVGQLDQDEIYAIDTSSHLFKCQGDCSEPSDVVPVDTSGYAPASLSADPVSKQMWMTSTTSSNVGNIFTKLSSPDYSSIMNAITPIDRTRDTIVAGVVDEYNKQTDVMTINKQVEDVVAFLSKLFKTGNDTSKITDDQSSGIQDKIRQTQQNLDQLSSTQPLMQNFVILLLFVVLIYMFGSALGNLIHWAAILVLVGGFYYISNFSQPTNNG
jgi:hypothetical protein